MSGAAFSFDDVAAQKASAAPKHHDRSTIEFPYSDIDAAVAVATAIYNRSGHSSCDDDELAAAMGHTISGTFRMKISAARLFGYAERDGRGKLRLTELGQSTVNSDSKNEARALGFLNVELYRQIYEKYRGHLLPPAKALEREMTAVGVAPKQADKARQTFERSARQSGFFAQGDDRLVQPRFDRDPLTKTTTKGDADNPASKSARERMGGGSGGGGGDGAGFGAQPNKSVSEVLLAAFDPKDMDDAQQEAVWTLLKYFKSKGI